MVRTVKYSLIISLFLSITFYSGYSHAATLIIENNTKLTIEVFKNSERQLNAEFLAVVPPETEYRIDGNKKGVWNIHIWALVPGKSEKEYPRISKTVVLNSDSSVERIMVLDKDFGKSAIVGPSCDPSMGGKYSNFLKRIAVPTDKSGYGECKDYGWWGNTSYAGHQNLPKGYWVYVYPDWYIWGESKTGRTSTKKTSGCDTTMGGKYSDKLRTVSVPDDVREYGKCRDYGWWSGTEYKGHKNLPPGYWVYDAPNWVIYGKKK